MIGSAESSSVRPNTAANFPSLVHRLSGCSPAEQIVTGNNGNWTETDDNIANMARMDIGMKNTLLEIISFGGCSHRALLFANTCCINDQMLRK